MKIAIIPARGNSKRIKSKNIKNFFGKPIIRITYEILKKTKIFDKIVLSTEDEKISKICKNFGFTNIIKRPSKLATDHVSTIDVIQHAIKILEKEYKISSICCVYPCNPFLKKKTLLKAYSLLKDRKDFIFPIINFPVPIQQALEIKNDKLSYVTPNFSKFRTQKLRKSFYDAGQFYLGTRYSWLVNKKTFKGIILPKYSSIDIDDNEDWLFSKSLYKLLKNEKKL